MYLVFIFSVSALGAGRVSELCNINRVNKLEILNLPMFVTTQIAMNENDLKLIYKYKVVVNNMQKRNSDEIINLLQMKYTEQVKNNNIRWAVNIISDKGGEM